MVVRISESTVRRLSHYYRVLEELDAEGGKVVSSRRLAEREGVTPAQVRKDLSCFGSFGRRGLGYSVAHLRSEIRTILGLDRRWRVAVAGAGHIGSALLAYRGFAEQGFEVVAVFDRDPERIGQRIGTLIVHDIATMPEWSMREGIEIGVIATPAAAAQEVADLMVRSGLRGILNFAPRNLVAPPSVTVRNVDMTLEFESLSFALAAGDGRPVAAGSGRRHRRR
jgi:redox-sensing transcriptional repressor